MVVRGQPNLRTGCLLSQTFRNYIIMLSENGSANRQQQPRKQWASEVVAAQCYMVRFRPQQQIYSAVSQISTIVNRDIVMMQTEHGLEPAEVTSLSPVCVNPQRQRHGSPWLLVRNCTRDESEKYQRLIVREQEAFDLGRQYINKCRLPMKLIKVERFFNGSKIIFYFTAEIRVDFRDLVKKLVQEFRTRVEIRQIGVRHETKMVGGLGCCGRELCCSSFLKNFAPVSIKMAKEQGLPLNPAKISGTCNRLLCCLTYESETYRAIRKKMPRPGKNIILNGRTYKVLKHNILAETIVVAGSDNPDEHIAMSRKEWQNAISMPKSKGRKEVGLRKK